jgi:hypothetical protein
MTQNQLEFAFIKEIKPGRDHGSSNRPFVEWPYAALLNYEKDLRMEMDYYALYEPDEETAVEQLQEEYEDLLCAMNWQQQHMHEPND